MTSERTVEMWSGIEWMRERRPAVIDFYRDAVSLDVLAQGGPTATLGRQGLAIMVLRHSPELPERNARGAGLYHTAIVFRDERHLAGSLASMARRAAHLYEGSADHIVSEAFYFRDPEGNGLELYRDRPRGTWRFSPDGTVQMGAPPLDPNAFLQRWHDPDRSEPDSAPSAATGHVHLQVGDIGTARLFYVDALADRLRFAGVDGRDDGRALRFTDPWGTAIVASPDGD